MIRKLLKTVAAHTLHLTGVDSVVGAVSGESRRPLVACYHRVVEDVCQHPWSAPAMLVSRRVLEAQLDWIGKRYRFVGLDEIATTLEAGRRFAAPVAAVTFDDGYADVSHHAMPLLRRKGIPAALFVVTGSIGQGKLHHHDHLFMLLRAASMSRTVDLSALLRRHGIAAPTTELVSLVEYVLATLPRRLSEPLAEELETMVSIPADAREALQPMSWPMLADLSREGVVIGSHSHTHGVLPNEPRATVISELAESKRILEERLAIDVSHLAFPAGRYCPFSLQAAAQAGYRYVYTTCSHPPEAAPPLLIARRTFWERSTAGFARDFSPAIAACQVRGVFDLVRPCRFDHGPRRSPHAAGPELGRMAATP